MSRSGRIPRFTTGLAVTLATVLAAGLLAPSPARAVEDPPEVKPADRVVGGKDRKVKPRKLDKVGGKPVPPTVWPTPGKAEVDVPSGRSAKPVPVGKAPITLAAPSGGKDVADKVTVRVLDRAATTRAGIDGAAFLLSAADKGDAGTVAAEIDYSGFAHAYGGDYGSRLRLVAYPACVLATPDKAACATPRPVGTARNNGEKQVLSGEVEVADPVVLAAASGSDSEKGDYKATDLKASATWQVSEQTGDFGWEYPMRTPPVPGELTPDLKISYSSQSVDGRTANTNNQPSWVGEGFQQWPGFIERKYKPCADDGAPKNHDIDPGDQCWAYGNATVTWNGKGGELIKASDGSWRMKNDDGTRFEKLTSSNRGNGDNDGEYWRVTTTDGTRYYFGFHRLPGWSSGKPETNSAWTAPVFGNDSGEPCHGDTFASSWCRQAWRWNLDYVVDPHGNAIAYYYDQESNYYGRNVTPSADTKYVRGGTLNRIEYGLRSSSMYGTKAAARVVFGTSQRCIPTSSFDCDPAKIKDNPGKWPDVPWDMNCKSGDECALKGKISPTFWSRKRLAKVTTQVIKSDGSGYRSVDSWSLDHKFGDADIDKALLLESIQHTGHAGGSPVTLPKVTFNHLQLMNRLDKSGDDIPAFIKYRLGAVFDESGGQVDVNYSGRQCSLSDLPAPASNTKRCFPVYWTPEGEDDPKRDWFHKYVVDETIESDRTGDSPDMITRYEYLGGAAWHYDTDDGLTKKKHKTWSQWRGYGRVRVRTGGFDDSMLTLSEKRFLRGMNGDRASKDGGAKTVTVDDGEGGTHTDHEAYSGHLLKEIDYTKPGGSIVEKTVNTPWKHETAKRTRSWGTTTANLTGTRKEHGFTAVPGGWRETHTFTDFETTAGLPTQIDDRSDTSTSADNRCTRISYAKNTGTWLLDFPSRQETVAVRCDQTPDRSTQVISDERSHYDGKDVGQAPAKGDITKTERIAGHDGQTARYVTKGSAAFDTYGRKTGDADAYGQLTKTAYTDVRGLTTKKTVTTPAVNPDDPSTAHTQTEEYDPAWGLPVKKVNPGGKVTNLAYDAMGRLTKVWLPDRPSTSSTPNLEFTYRITEGKIVAVGTKKITAQGGQSKTSYALYDGMLRPRQTQELGPDGGRLIADTLYDSRGNKTTEYQTYYNADSGPAPTLFGAYVGDIETQIDYTHDGLNRPTVERLMVGNNTPTEKWRTTTSYSGDRESVTPPDGGTPATTIKDARDQTTEIRHYKGDAPSGDYEAIRYTYTPAGKLATVTDPAGNRWRYSYDLRGRKTKEEDPDKGTTTYTYDLLDRQITSTDARGRTQWNRYDPLGRKIAVRDRGATGPLRTSWTYDTIRKGLLTKSTRHVSGEQYTNEVVQYDNLDRPRIQRVVIPAAEGPLGGSYQFTTSHNLDGTVRGQGHPAVGDLQAENIAYTYDDDDLGRPVRASGTDTLVGQALWSHTGKLQQLQLSATAGKRAWISNEWEWGTQRLARSHVRRENQPRADRDARYSYDDAGNITKISDASATGVDTQCFSYGFRRRLTDAWTQTDKSCADAPSKDVVGGPAPYWQSFSYDTAGNRTKETRHGLDGDGDTTRSYDYPTAGAPQPHTLTTVTEAGPDGTQLDTFDYDLTGNTTRRNLAGDEQNLAWDAEGHLEKVTDKDGKQTSFAYDADGNRLIRREPDATTLYLPNGTEVKLNNANQGVSATRYYEFAGQTVAMRTKAGLTYLATDHHGSGSLQINATTQGVTQRRIEPFGNSRGDSPQDWLGDKGFVGGTEDSTTGLVHLGAREYDPLVGRFISVDPIMDLTDPQQMHGYAYANWNPITESDPTGLCSMSCLEYRHTGDYIKDGKVKRAPKGVRRAHGVGEYYRGPRRSSYAHYRFSYPKRRPPIPPCDLSCKIKRAISTIGSFDGWAGNYRDFSGGVISSLSSMGCGALPTCGLSRQDEVIDALLGMYGVDQESGWFQGGYWGTTGASLLVGGGGGGAAAAIGAVARGSRVLGAGRGLTARARRVACSFIPGTPVLLADGSTKPIEEIKIGDKVLATDPEMGKTEAKDVVGTVNADGLKHLVSITVDPDGAPNLGDISANGAVTATANHPFWVEDLKRWVPAGDLRPGMWLRTSAGTFVEVSAVKTWTARQAVHNLTVDAFHSYHVVAGKTAPLVHNAGEGGCGYSIGNGSPGKSFGESDGARFAVESKGTVWDRLKGPYQGSSNELNQRGPTWIGHPPRSLPRDYSTRSGKRGLLTELGGAIKDYFEHMGLGGG